MSLQSSSNSDSSANEEQQLLNYLVLHQGISKTLLFKWCSTKTNGYQLRRYFWRCVETKNQIFFNNKTKKVYFFDELNFIIGRFFINSRSRKAYVVSTTNKKATNTQCEVPKNLNINVYDLVLLKKRQYNNYFISECIAENVQWISGTLCLRKHGNWTVNIHSFFMQAPVFIDNIHDLPLKNGALVQISNPRKSNNRLVAKLYAIISTNQTSLTKITELCKKHEIKYIFDEKVINASNKIIKNKEKYPDYRARRDLTKDFFVTIDSSQSKDLDDAFSVTKKNNGVYKLRVAIADVSNYVSYGNTIDTEAQSRSCSSYFSNIVHPMIPPRISNNICSLNCDSEKFVIVCDIDYDTIKNDVIKYSLYHAKIQSKHQLSYTFVNQTLSQDQDTDESLHRFLNNSNQLSNCIHSKYAQKRQFTINREELWFIVDKNNVVKNIEWKKQGIAERIIETFMMLANHCVAKFMTKNKISGIYRRHESIKRDNLLQAWNIIANIYPLKFSTHFTSSSATSDIYKSLHLQDSFIKENIIPLLVLFSFYEPAYYSASSGSHFGLGIKAYCHFTSPIRRYSDLYVHYAITDFLYKESGLDLKNNHAIEINTDINELCFNINYATKASYLCERDFHKVQQAQFLKTQSGNKIYDGYITNIFRGRVYLAVSVYGGSVMQSDLGSDYYIEDSDLKTLTGRTSNKKYQIGDKVKVLPKFINDETGSILWKLI